MLEHACVMGDATTGRLTQLLREASEGSDAANDELYALVYEDLRALARRHASFAPSSDTLQPTALVHEAFLRVAEREGLEPGNARHFFFVLSRAMRDVVIEHARRRRAAKRGGAWTRVPLTGQGDVNAEIDVDALDLYDALQDLRHIEPQVEQIISLRCFAGLSLRKVAALLDITLAKVRSDWEYGVAWLYDRIGPGSTESGAGQGSTE